MTTDEFRKSMEQAFGLPDEPEAPRTADRRGLDKAADRIRVQKWMAEKLGAPELMAPPLTTYDLERCNALRWLILSTGRQNAVAGRSVKGLETWQQLFERALGEPLKG